MRVYISGPMTGIEDENFPAFNRASALLRSMGFDVENPADKGIIEGWEWEDYLRYDLKMMADCQAIYLLPGWENSKGARLEVHVARALNFRFLYDSENVATPALAKV